MKQQKGISLLELMLVLAVLMILALSAVRYVKTTRAVARLADGVSVIQILINATEDWQRAHKGVGGLSYMRLQDRGLVPSSTQNPWGGAIHVSGLSNGQVTFILDDVPLAECENFADILQKKQVHGDCLASGGFEGVYPDE